MAVLYGKGDTFCAGYDLEYLSTRGPDEFLRWLTPPGEGDGPMVRYNVYVYDRHWKYEIQKLFEIMQKLGIFFAIYRILLHSIFLNGRLLFCSVFFFLVCFVLHSLIVCPLVQ